MNGQNWFEYQPKNHQYHLEMCANIRLISRSKPTKWTMQIKRYPELTKTKQNKTKKTKNKNKTKTKQSEVFGIEMWKTIRQS